MVVRVAFAEIVFLGPVLLEPVFVVLAYEVELVLVLKASEVLIFAALWLVFVVASPEINQNKKIENECLFVQTQLNSKN